MRCCQLALLTRKRGTHASRIASRIAIAFLSTMGLFSTLAAAKLASSSQEKEKKAPHLHWNPPQVDARMTSLSATPPCSLPDVLKQAGQRAAELLDHLQNFIAHEQIRYDQTDREGMLQISLAAKFDYLVDFGKPSQAFKVHETRTPLAGTDDRDLSAIVDKGLPVLALIFYPALQGDYEMRCEGSTQLNNQPAWVIHFRQIKGKRPRTTKMETATVAYPLSLKGRAWIAAESGQVMHLETNLVEPLLLIDLQTYAVSLDYASVKFQSQNVDIWLPQFAISYMDYDSQPHSYRAHFFRLPAL